MIKGFLQEVQRMTLVCDATDEEIRKVLHFVEVNNMTIVRRGPPFIEGDSLRVDMTKHQVVAERCGPQNELVVST